MALTKIPGNLIQTGAITAAALDNDAVTTAKILDANITHAKLHATMDLTGKTVTVATAAGSTNTTAAASTAFVQQELTSGLAPKATIASPTFTGTPSAPTASGGTNTTALASTAFVQQELTTLIGGAPSTLNDLNELAAAINDDANYNTTLTTALATKLPLAGGTLTGGLVITAGNGNQLQLNNAGERFTQIGLKHSGAQNGALWLDDTDSMVDLYANTSHGIRLKTGGDNPRVTILSGGNVGIGVTVPTTALHVNGAISLDYGTGVSYQGIKRTSVGNEYYVGTTSTGTHEIHTFTGSSAVKKMVILESGNVGIGTATPGAKLTVRNSANWGESAVLLADTNAEGPAFLSLQKYPETQAAGGAVQMGNGDYIGGVIMKGFTNSGTNSKNYIEIWGRAMSVAHGAESSMLNIGTYASGTEHANTLVAREGNVGIGTANPYGKLQIEGNTNEWATSPILIFASTSTANAAVRDWAIGPADSNYGDFHIVQGASTGASPLSTSNAKLTISAAGNVGIGTTTPAYALEVNGQVKSAEGLHSNNWQVYNTGTAGFLIGTNILVSDYAHIHGEIKLQQFNYSTHQIIHFSATVAAAGVSSYAASSDIPVTIKLFKYAGTWYIWVPSPSNYSDISAYIHMGAGYQGTSRSSNAITTLSNGGVPGSGVTNSVDIIAKIATPGSVIQTQYATNSTAVTLSQTHGTYSTIVQVNITPKYATSKILITGLAAIELIGGHYPAINCKIYRDGTEVESYILWGYEGNVTTHRILMEPLHYVDSPTTTSALTYYVKISNAGGSSVSGTYNGRGNGYNTSVVTVQEIAQ